MRLSLIAGTAGSRSCILIATRRFGSFRASPIPNPDSNVASGCRSRSVSQVADRCREPAREARSGMRRLPNCARKNQAAAFHRRPNTSLSCGVRRLSSGRRYREVRGTGFTHKLLEGLENEQPGGTRRSMPTATIVAVLAILAILAVLAVVGWKMTRSRAESRRDRRAGRHVFPE